MQHRDCQPVQAQNRRERESTEYGYQGKTSVGKKYEGNGTDEFM